MAWYLPFVLLALVVCASGLLGALAYRKWRRRKGRKASVTARPSVPFARAPARSQVIVLGGDALKNLPSVHEAPTREFAAYVEELAAQSMNPALTRELAVHEAPTRELTAYREDPLDRQQGERAVTSSGFQPRARSAGRRDEEPTLKIVHGEAQDGDGTEQLLRMLGPSPTPSLSNIEVYYRLGLVYLASGKEIQARRCFLTVEEVSPGYRDAAAHLAELPIHAPTCSGATPVHHIGTTSDFAEAYAGGTSAKREPTQGRRNGR